MASAGIAFAPEFAPLQAALGDIMGQPIEADHPGDQDCDAEQLTTIGLAYWTCATSLAAFVSAAGDQERHWAMIETTLVEWLGDPVDPPPSSERYALSGVLTLTCVGPNEDAQHACVLPGSAITAGLVDAPGTDEVYRFRVSADAQPVELQLTDLPADYDLYVVDSAGLIVGESVNEGLQPEIVDAMLASGTYFAYVHSDPGRPVAPDTPFVLHVDLNAAIAQPTLDPAATLVP